MTAEERLETALRVAGRGKGYDWFPIAADVFLADPHLAQDIADGAALRRLREALPEGWTVYTTGCATDVHLRVWGKGRPELSIHRDTIAEAADACREALG